MLSNNLFRKSSLYAFLLAGTVGAAHGAVLVTNFKNVAPAGGAVHALHDPSLSGGADLLSASSTDLIQGLPATVTYTGGSGNVNFEQSAGSSVWTNGSLTTVYAQGGNAGDAIDHAAYGIVTGITGGSTVHTYITYDLGALYNISQVDVYTGWNDSGRDDSSFEVHFSVDGVTYVKAGDYFKGPDDTNQISTPVTNLHRFTEDTSGEIASGVRYVQFIFTDADNGRAGLVELDVFGTAVPEPSVALLGGLGVLGLLRRRR